MGYVRPSEKANILYLKRSGRRRDIIHRDIWGRGCLRHLLHVFAGGWSPDGRGAWLILDGIAGHNSVRGRPRTRSDAVNKGGRSSSAWTTVPENTLRRSKQSYSSPCNLAAIATSCDVRFSTFSKPAACLRGALDKYCRVPPRLKPSGPTCSLSPPWTRVLWGNSSLC